MNKRIRNKIQKHQALEHQDMAEAAQQLSLRDLAGETATKAVHEATAQALAFEAKAEKLLEKVPLIGQRAADKLHELAERVADEANKAVA